MAYSDACYTLPSFIKWCSGLKKYSNEKDIWLKWNKLKLEEKYNLYEIDKKKINHNV